MADKNPEITRWLSPLDPRRRHHDVRTDRRDGVGDWFLGTKEFQERRSNEGGTEEALLFCYGNLGGEYISKVSASFIWKKYGRNYC